MDALGSLPPLRSIKAYLFLIFESKNKTKSTVEQVIQALEKHQGLVALPHSLGVTCRRSTTTEIAIRLSRKMKTRAQNDRLSLRLRQDAGIPRNHLLPEKPAKDRGYVERQEVTGADGERWSSGMMRTTVDAQPHPGQLEVPTARHVSKLSAGRRWARRGWGQRVGRGKQGRARVVGVAILQDQ